MFRLISESFPCARKPHKCIWCGERIVVGEKYRRERSVFDDNMQDHKWHLDCDADAAEYFKHGDSEFSAYENERPSKVSQP